MPADRNGKCVLFWMQRSQRADFNPALDKAVALANENNVPLVACFVIVEDYPLASERMFRFMLEGLVETAESLAQKGVPFVVRKGSPAEVVASIAKKTSALAVVCDEDYLRTGRAWRERVARECDMQVLQVDAETVVPVRMMEKEEYGAYTIRPKIHAKLEEYTREYRPVALEKRWEGPLPESLDMENMDVAEFARRLKTQEDVAPIQGVSGGVSHARKRLDDFICNSIEDYDAKRNDIGREVTSGLSSYLHFGQISSLECVQTVRKSRAPKEAIDTFIEQIVVRRELAINYCFFNEKYDSIEAAPDWARKTLTEHSEDKREIVYSLKKLENAETHDELWNAAQTELVKSGKIHNYMRMVWAKNILQWSLSAEEALERTIYLNDKYALDGRDANGYANIAWCIFGKHDRAFGERPVSGKVRFMSSSATKRKTDWKAYMERVRDL